MQSLDLLCSRSLGLKCVWDQGSLLATELSYPCKAKPEGQGLTPWGQRLQKVLDLYTQGRPTTWPEPPFYWPAVSRFAQEVIGTLSQTIGWGQWTTYHQLAQACGRPNASRAVGQVMANNPWPLIIPCHRVLTSGGGLGGFRSGLGLKRFLLDLEGIPWT